jgi:hypothetical protein
VPARDRHAVLASCSARRDNLSPLGLPKALLFKHAWQASPSHACTPSASDSQFLFPMETGRTVQESALHAGRQAWWPLDATACCLEDTSGGGGGGAFLLGWDPQLSYFGLGAWGVAAGDLGTYERELELVVPKCKSRSALLHVCISFLFPFPAAPVSMALTRLLSGMCARHGVPGVGDVNGGSHRLADAAGCDGDARGAG